MRFKDFISALFLGSGVGLFFLSVFIAFYATGRLDPQNLARFKNLKGYVVLSGSMEPAIKTGSVVFILPSVNYQIGDVITFRENGVKNLITHRIESVEIQGDKKYFFTKGDANEEGDNQEVYLDQIVGKVNFSIPYLGYLVEWAKTPKGFIVFVVIPATIVIYEELKALTKEFLKLVREVKNKLFGRDINYPKAIFNPVENYALRLLLLIPIIGASFLLVSFSSSLLKDIEKATANLMVAGENFQNSTVQIESTPTPSPETSLEKQQI